MKAAANSIIDDEITVLNTELRIDHAVYNQFHALQLPTCSDLSKFFFWALVLHEAKITLDRLKVVIKIVTYIRFEFNINLSRDCFQWSTIHMSISWINSWWATFVTSFSKIWKIDKLRIMGEPFNRYYSKKCF